MGIAIATIGDSPFLDGFLSHIQGNMDVTHQVLLGAFHCQLEGIEQVARISSRQLDQVEAGVLIQLDRPVAIASSLSVRAWFRMVANCSSLRGSSKKTRERDTRAGITSK